MGDIGDSVTAAAHHPRDRTIRYVSESRAVGAAALPRGGEPSAHYSSPHKTSLPRSPATVSRDQVQALNDRFSSLDSPDEATDNLFCDGCRLRGARIFHFCRKRLTASVRFLDRSGAGRPRCCEWTSEGGDLITCCRIRVPSVLTCVPLCTITTRCTKLGNAGDLLTCCGVRSMTGHFDGGRPRPLDILVSGCIKKLEYVCPCGMVPIGGIRYWLRWRISGFQGENFAV